MQRAFPSVIDIQGSFELHRKSTLLSLLIFALSFLIFDRVTSWLLRISVRKGGWNRRGNSRKSVCYSMYSVKWLQRWLLRIIARSWNRRGKFLKVRSLLNVLCKMTTDLTFENIRQSHVFLAVCLKTHILKSQLYSQFVWYLFFPSWRLRISTRATRSWRCRPFWGR